ncbi:MAG: hypothetical protein IH840_04205, partial [Candidatus Heimdallarchaeota archaeon]|nr:hypothetical protein [Candidatus Heimdallarchaeota archaeon]
MEPDLIADKILAEAMMHMLQTAARDGVITDEEAEIVDKIEYSLRFFRQMLVDAMADGVITQEEQDSLIRMKDKMIEEGYNVAEASSDVSKDELNLL